MAGHPAAVGAARSPAKLAQNQGHRQGWAVFWPRFGRQPALARKNKKVGSLTRQVHPVMGMRVRGKATAFPEEVGDPTLVFQVWVVTRTGIPRHVQEALHAACQTRTGLEILGAAPLGTVTGAAEAAKNPLSSASSTTCPAFPADCRIVRRQVRRPVRERSVLHTAPQIAARVPRSSRVRVQSAAAAV